MLALKEYQQRALDALTRFFDRCVDLDDAGKAFESVTADPEVWGQALRYNGVQELPGLPYICLRVPTGGGKTLMGCYSARIALQHLLHVERGVVLWLVPSNAIREQTLKALQDRRHNYRRALEMELGAVEVIDISEALNLQRATLDSQTVVIVSTIQAFRVEDTEGRKVYEQSGALAHHFQGITNEQTIGLDLYENGIPIQSLANVLRLRRPVVIVDEAHNARTDLSFETLARLQPSCIIEYTATPDREKNPSNILYSVSAAQLQTENMIKVPIRLETRSNWKEVLADAVAQRKELERLALLEREATGEYLRPILLIQAQAHRQNAETLDVNVIDTCLRTEFEITPNQIARSTATDKELEDVVLSDPECEIRFVLTIQALREGWDCPFAYVLCTVAAGHSTRAVEQILGRVMRLPGAKRKQHEDLNRAYAFATSQSWGDAAHSLTDALVVNGFSKQDASDMIVPAVYRQSGFQIDDLSLFSGIISVELSEIPDVSRLSDRAKSVVSFDESKRVMTVHAQMPSDVRGELSSVAAKAVDRTAIESAYLRSQSLPTGATRRSPKSSELTIPVLAIRNGDLFEQLEEEHLIRMDWSLNGCDANLSEIEYSAIRQDGSVGEIDFSEAGKPRALFLYDLHNHLFSFDLEAGQSAASLADWLDRNIPHHDISREESVAFLLKLVQLLLGRNNTNLSLLYRDRFRLLRAAAAKIEMHRLLSRKNALQGLLLPIETSPIVVTPKVCFTYELSQYPCSRYYSGNYQFQKHFFQKVGELSEQGEELRCAQFLDQNPKILTWVRNLSGRPRTSFWIQTHTDRFYPDFVCLLEDGRFLVVEYKGALIASTDDTKEKRGLGEIWEKRSNGKCLFVMAEREDFGDISQKIAS